VSVRTGGALLGVAVAVLVEVPVGVLVAVL